MERKYIYDFLVEHNISNISKKIKKTADELENLSSSELRDLFVENSKYLREGHIQVDCEYYKEPEYYKENDELYAQFAARATIVVRGETQEECDNKAEKRFKELNFGEYTYVDGCELKCESEEIQIPLNKKVLFDEITEGLKDGSVNIRYEGYICYYGYTFDEFIYKFGKGNLDATLKVTEDNDIVIDFCGLAYRYQYGEISETGYRKFKDALRTALERDDAEMAKVIYCESNKYSGVLYDYYSDDDIYRDEALSRKREIDEGLKTKTSIERD